MRIAMNRNPTENPSLFNTLIDEIVTVVLTTNFRGD